MIWPATNKYMYIIHFGSKLIGSGSENNVNKLQYCETLDCRIENVAFIDNNDWNVCNGKECQ